MSVRADPEAFAQTVKDANINSIMIFAKCHHGMSHYPTKVAPSTLRSRGVT